MALRTVTERTRVACGNEIRETGRFTSHSVGIDFEILTTLGHIREFTVIGLESSGQDRDGAWFLNSNDGLTDNVAGQGGRVYFDGTFPLSGIKVYQYIAKGVG